jgi:formamidopyrimidine-DNA glycosylase
MLTPSNARVAEGGRIGEADAVPELPDIQVYLDCLDARCRGRVLERLRVTGPSLLRSVDPPVAVAEGRKVVGLRRLGKRIAFALEGDLFLVFHLMIAGRLRWRERGTRPSRKTGLAALEFDSGTLLVTEASTHKRATLHLVRGERALAEHDRGGLEVLEASAPEFRARIARENRTLKRALTDPRILSGIGNAYSDEILHRARLSPVKLTGRLSRAEVDRLYAATHETLEEWIARLRQQVGDGFPEKVTAFRPEMAVHGRYGKPCPSCDAPVQRIVYASNETHYCAACQTDGVLLADRALSRLLKKDWPRSLEELEARKRKP